MRSVRPVLMALVVIVAATAPRSSAQTLLRETFDNNSAGWTMTGDWAIGPATGSSGSACGNGDPSVDAGGVVGGGVAGTNLGGPIQTSAGATALLTSPVIDARCARNLRLEFARFLNSDYLPFIDNFVEVFDGDSWVRVETYGTMPSDQVNDSSWTAVWIDLSPYNHANLQIRFGYTVLVAEALPACSGWNLDNVRVTGRGIFYDPFNNNFAGWDLGNLREQPTLGYRSRDGQHLWVRRR